MKKFFPALNKYKNFYFFNNSAGSQVPNQVIEKVNDYIIDGYSQPFDKSKSLTAYKNKVVSFFKSALVE